jgi:hypothetical protein
MFRKALVTIAVIAVVVIGFFWLRAGRNTPQAAAKNFTNNLATGKAEAAYAQLSSGLTTGRESYWRNYLKPFADQKATPTFGKEDQVVDTFNTYSDAEDPHRFTYTFHLKDNDYQMVMLLVKQGKTWKIDELGGSKIKK